MDNASLVILPVEKVREMIEIAVSGCLDKVLAALQPRQESESVDIEGALEFLNSNGYRIAKGQLYKETSAGNIPYHKFGHRWKRRCCLTPCDGEDCPLWVKYV